ncbi:MAG: enoyl-CoA hydratase/isomerase family protein [Rhizobiales bacterium]|nr:enoyl-CoA hydratase/isomerase family protein [Hyphomicrobiales bacterium]
MANAEPVLLSSIENKVCLLTLNRPDSRNALSLELASALRQAVLDADDNADISVIAITGSGSAFCSGADLKEVDAGKKKRGPLHQQERSPYEVMIDCRKPLLAIVNGPAVAGGFELALACDLRVAAATAFFALPEAKRSRGAHLASVLLPTMVPSGIAMEWLLTSRRISMEEAERWGIVNRVTNPDQLMSIGMTLARDIASSAPLSIQRMKLTFRKSHGLPLHAGLRLDVGPDPYSSEDAKEGARAFLERRQPVWVGR